MNISSLGKRVYATISVALLCQACGSVEAQPTFTTLGVLPGGAYSQSSGISGDGTTVTGFTFFTDTGHSRAFRWTSAGGMQDLGMLSGGSTSRGGGVSFDGSTVTGFSGTSSGDRAFRWTSGGMQNLGVLPGAGSSFGNAISANGAVVVGNGPSPVGHAFRWTSSLGMQDLGLLPGGSTSTAYGVNADGSVVTGYSTSAAGPRAFRWTQGGGMADLGVIPGQSSSYGYGISADGAVVVGESDGATRRAFRWTAGGMQDLGILPGRSNSSATSVSADGSALVGFSYSEGSLGRHGFLWTTELGMVDLNTYLPSLGVDLGSWVLETPNGISADGSAMTGLASINGTGLKYAFVVTGIPAPGAWVMLSLCGLFATRRHRYP